MKTIAWLTSAAALCVLLAGCPKRNTLNVAGSDDEQMDQLSAKLEELRARVASGEPKCQDWCAMSSDVCDISRMACDISGRHADRADMQSRCVSAQEECARF